ncbi:MAG: DNA-processing protein DprA [bacterium]|nr:DNA-processing protein DprA [bacterium]
MTKEATYWIALAHLPKWGYLKINNLIIKFFHEEKISIEDFFNLPESIWSDKYQLTPQDISDLQKAKSELPNNAFFAENLSSQGFELIPITSPEYSKTLKQNLKAAHSPALLYIKGNKKILYEKSIAIVGSRDAGKNSLEFTDNIAKLASKDFKVIVSGFAKGVDKQALDSAIKYTGQSIIVLPQGITTFSSGFKKYYRQIVDGNILVLSVFHPKAVWSAGLAMARNPVIYGLADEIFVAESSQKGGTWSGVVDGLRKGRKIYVRQPEPNEKNANNLLIQKGAIPVDFNGVENPNSEQMATTSIVNKPSMDTIEDRILKVFNGKTLSAKEILEKLKLDLTTKELTIYLQKMETIQTVKKGQKNYYTLKSNQQEQQTKLFG